MFKIKQIFFKETTLTEIFNFLIAKFFTQSASTTRLSPCPTYHQCHLFSTRSENYSKGLKAFLHTHTQIRIVVSFKNQKVEMTSPCGLPNFFEYNKTKFANCPFPHCSRTVDEKDISGWKLQHNHLLKNSECTCIFPGSDNLY